MGGGGMMLNTTFNNISAISCWSVSLVEETGVPVKKPTDLPHVTDKLYHIKCYIKSTPHWSEIKTHNVSADRH